VERSAELDWIRRYLTHLAEGSTQLAAGARPLAAATYTSQERLSAETRLVRRMPTVAGLSADLPNAGSYFSIDIGGVPLFLTRLANGEARAFVNGCRHRGSPLVTGHGCADGGLLRCPFHAWTYGTDGQLHATPTAERAFESLDRSDMGLHARPCVESDGLLLVRAEGDEPIDAGVTLQGLLPDIQAVDLPRYHRFDTRTTRWSCNWKLVLDTFLESYHVFSLHRESVHPWYFSHPMFCEGWGPNLRFIVARRSIEGLRERPEADWRLADHATIQWLIGPNALLTYTSDYVMLWRFFSSAPSRCEIRTSLYSSTPVQSDAERKRLEAAFDLQMRVAGDEDFLAQERVQGVIDSGALPQLVLGANEVATIRFHDALDALLSDTR
jgi:phenylpropionate dioxygenase-like ring-hydroxylating dioxygenase large terminal subunit